MMNNLYRVKFNALGLVLSIVCITIYCFSCIYSVEVMQFHGDTLEYLHDFKEIQHSPLPYGLEFFSPSVMWMVSYLGGDFKLFLLVCLFMWIPLIALIGYLSKKRMGYFFVFLFFITPYFIDNVVFLIRQYSAALFFIFYFFLRTNKSNQNKKKPLHWLHVTLLLLSFFSHLSAILWFLLTIDRVVSIINSSIVKFFLILVALGALFDKIDLINFFVSIFTSLAVILGRDEITRKALFYTSAEFGQVATANHLVVMLVVMIFFMSLFYLRNANRFNKKLYIFVFVHAFFVLIFKDNAVMANRIGFFAFYFSIPITFIYLMHLLSGKYMQSEIANVTAQC